MSLGRQKWLKLGSLTFLSLFSIFLYCSDLLASDAAGGFVLRGLGGRRCFLEETFYGGRRLTPLTGGGEENTDRRGSDEAEAVAVTDSA